jgi:hypothetical protein
VDEEVEADKHSSGKWPLGTKVAKQFGEERFEGTYRKYHNDEDEDLYWIVYSDGDHEDFNAVEMQQGVKDYRTHFIGTDLDDVDFADGGSEDTAAEYDIEEVTTTTVDYNNLAISAISSNSSSSSSSSSSNVSTVVVARAELDALRAATINGSAIQPQQFVATLMQQHQHQHQQMIMQQQQFQLS